MSTSTFGAKPIIKADPMRKNLFGGKVEDKSKVENPALDSKSSKTESISNLLNSDKESLHVPSQKQVNFFAQHVQTKQDSENKATVEKKEEISGVESKEG